MTRTNDVVATQAEAANSLAAAMPFNAAKPSEYGHDNALATNQGVAVADNQHSLKAGLRGPALLEDFILREKITHFDHERIVHARGSGAHGNFEAFKVIEQDHDCSALLRSRQGHAGIRPLFHGRR